METGKIVTGNYYDKYNSSNAIEKILVKGFIDRLNGFVSEITPKTVLDIGSGEGYVDSVLRKNFPEAHIVSTDITDEHISKSSIAGGELIFVINSLPALCFKKESFDLVLAIEVLEHLEEPAAAVESIFEATKRHAIITVPDEPLWSLMNMARLKYLSRFGNTPGHVQAFSKRSLYNLLDKRFKKVNVRKQTPWLMAVCEKD